MRPDIKFCAVAGCLMLGGFTAEAAENLEIGINELAREIVATTQGAEEQTIAVGAFVHRDGSCSDLTNLIYDELVYSLFSNAGETINVIERAELEQIFSEQELSVSGDIDIETAKELGRISGVDAIALGSISDYGDQIRINSRLVSAETGRVAAVARTDFPLTDSTRDLMKNRSKSFCGFREAGASGNQTMTVGSGSAEPSTTFMTEEFSVSLVAVAAEDDGTVSRLVFDINNLTDSQVHFTLFQPRMSWLSVSDQLGNFIEFSDDTYKSFDLRGAAQCSSSSIDHCDNQNAWSAIAPNSLARVSLNIVDPKQKMSAPLLIRISLAMMIDDEIIEIPVDFKNIYF